MVILIELENLEQDLNLEGKYLIETFYNKHLMNIILKLFQYNINIIIIIVCV